jgi:hypothetical protein
MSDVIVTSWFRRLSASRYRLGAFNAPGQSTPHQHHDSILKDEAVELLQIVIILRFLVVVLITIQRRVCTI